MLGRGEEERRTRRKRWHEEDGREDHPSMVTGGEIQPVIRSSAVTVCKEVYKTERLEASLM